MKINSALILTILCSFLIAPVTQAAGKVEHLLNQAQKQHARQNFQLAQASYIKALRLEPTNLTIQNSLVLTCIDEVTQDPTDAYRHLDLGNTKAFAGDFDTAKAEFTVVLSLDPGYVGVEALRLIKLIPGARAAYDPKLHSAEPWFKALDTLKSKAAHSRVIDD